MSYIVDDYYRNTGPVAFEDERYAPVPGWGMNPLLAGPRRIAVGGLGADEGPVDQVTGTLMVVAVFSRAQTVNTKLGANPTVLGPSWPTLLAEWNAFYADIKMSVDQFGAGTLSGNNPIWKTYNTQLMIWEGRASGEPTAVPPKPGSGTVVVVGGGGGSTTTPGTSLPAPVPGPTPTAPSTPAVPSAGASYEKYLLPGAAVAVGAAALYLWHASSKSKGSRLVANKCGSYSSNHPVDIEREPGGVFRIVRASDRKTLGRAHVVRRGSRVLVFAPKSLAYVKPLIRKMSR